MQNIPELKSVCISCMLNSRINQYPNEASEEQKVEYMLAVLRILSEMEDQHGPTLATCRIIELQRKMFGVSQDYCELKTRFNHFVLEKESYLRKNIEEADDSLKLAIQYGIVGNLIDFIVMDSVDQNQLEKMFLEASDYLLDENIYQLLKRDVQGAKKIVVLLDNCGEIVIDKLMIEVLKKMNPNAQITAIVRGEEILNDATMEDAVQVGLTDVVDIIGNGTNIPGTCLQFISKEAKNAIESADIILSKGQGNFETLQGYDKNIYYIFLCKCEMIAEMFGVEKFSPMLVK